MDDQSFDTLTRDAAGGLSRRSSLLALGAAGLAAIIPIPHPAAKRGKKKQKKQPAPPSSPLPPPVEDRCAPQVAPCAASFTAQCGTDPSCTSLIQCCDSLGTCDASGFFACLNSIKIAL